MNGSTLKCPNCGQPRTGTQQCPHCGIIFAKYAAKQRMLEEMEYQQQEEKEQKRSNLFKLSGLAIAAISAVALGYTLYTPGDDAGAPSPQSSPQANNFSNPYNPYNQYESKKLLDDDVRKKVASATFTVRNSKLRYPHNKGTGLLITYNCQAVTGWKLSQTKVSAATATSSDAVTNLKSRVEYYETQIEAKREKFIASCSDCSEEAFKRTVTTENRRLEDAIKSYNSAVDRMVQTTDTPDTLAATINKTAQTVRVDERNEPLGLSLLYVENTANCKPAPIGDSYSLKIGDKIFMMGSSGRVTDGIVTGFTTSNAGYKMITHSASAAYIGGLEGAPLFNAKGEVLGVNVASFGSDRNAIRIEDVLDAFKLVL